jgi:hypothetical protein
MGQEDATLSPNQQETSVAIPLAWGQLYADTMGIESLKQSYGAGLILHIFTGNVV